MTVWMEYGLRDRERQRRDPIAADLSTRLCAALDRGDRVGILALTECMAWLDEVRWRAALSVELN